MNPPIPSSEGGSEEEPQVMGFSHAPVAARVPERVSRGVMCTGQIVLDGPKEFVVDFLQGLSRPHQIVARVVMTAQTVDEFVTALSQNIERYEQNFGPLTPAPVPPPPARRPSLQEVYENFRLPDELLSGSYANSVLIGHTATEFFFDFITGFFPTSAVSARVYIAAPQVPRFVQTLSASLKQHHDRLSRGREQPPPTAPPPDEPT